MSMFIFSINHLSESSIIPSIMGQQVDQQQVVVVGRQAGLLVLHKSGLQQNRICKHQRARTQCPTSLESPFRLPTVPTYMANLNDLLGLSIISIIKLRIGYHKNKLFLSTIPSQSVGVTYRSIGVGKSSQMLLQKFHGVGTYLPLCQRLCSCLRKHQQVKYQLILVIL